MRSGRTFLGLPTAPAGAGQWRGQRSFPDAAHDALADTKLRRDLGKATSTIRARRDAVVAEVLDWQQLVMGIEKLVPTWADLAVYLQLLPRSSTGERMDPYTSTWTGAVEGQQFHLVLLDNGRTPRRWPIRAAARRGAVAAADRRR